MKRLLPLIALSGALLVSACRQAPELKLADSPLYIDPVYNGSTDPMVCFNPTTNTYYMYYTSRRANVEGLGGIESVHGSPIGIAESVDGGASWTYIGNANIDYAPDPNPTYWAPEVIYADGKFHMYLSYVPGIFDTWEYPRDIVHLTSDNGRDWKTESVLQLSTNRVIDACIYQLPDGTWRLWYNNETDNKSIYYADSPDLYNWTDKGKVQIETVGEGPNVFRFKGKYYMIVDEWKGLSIFTSDDLDNWTKQEGDYFISGQNGQRRGNHADVEVIGDHAYMFYFSSVPLPGTEAQQAAPAEGQPRRQRRGHAVFVTELRIDDNGKIFTDTTQDCYINLTADKKIKK